MASSRICLFKSIERFGIREKKLEVSVSIRRIERGQVLNELFCHPSEDLFV
jgi:hypothetical protein